MAAAQRKSTRVKKYEPQEAPDDNHMGFKSRCQWRRPGTVTTKRVFEMADQLVHELAKRELAALSACA